MRGEVISRLRILSLDNHAHEVPKVPEAVNENAKLASVNAAKELDKNVEVPAAKPDDGRHRRKRETGKKKW